MPDFTSLDPSLIASFWIYFIGSFVCGAALGFFGAKAFFHREKRIVAQERQSLQQEKSNWSEKQKQFEEMKQNLADKSAELDRLREEISKAETYWAAKGHTKHEASGAKMLYDMFHPDQKK